MPLPLPTQSSTLREVQRRLFRSRFITVSLLLHAILVVSIGGTVLFNRNVEPPDFSAEAGESFVTSTEAPPPPQSQQTLQQPSFVVNAPTTAMTAPALTALATSAPRLSAFSLPTLTAPVAAPALSTPIQQTGPTTSTFSGSIPMQLAQGIANFTSGWARGGAASAGTSVRNREFQFTAYLAKYSGGDWAATVTVKNGQITGGSLPNLLHVIGMFSHDRIKAEPQAMPLDIATDEMFVKKPPFIFFCGHRDFKLSDKEIENLRKYIQMGGCIWGDSSLPGAHSRFDIAFRREMRRVIPDLDRNFEPLPPTHDIYSHNPAKAFYSDIGGVPPGMNFYQEPVYAMPLYGEIAVLYTANDYGDMWQFGIDERGQIDERLDGHGHHIALDEEIWRQRDLYFRNINGPAIFATYKFGTNIVVHLLTRWEEKMRTVQRGL